MAGLYIDPTTVEHICHNIEYYIKETNEMKSIELLEKHESGFRFVNNGHHVKWKFIERILPELNTYIRQRWQDLEQPLIDEELSRLKSELKKLRKFSKN